ncbi:MAG: patatin-like phospholipase family protein [Desulfobacterota bacterium]|nr:patatin-like phospholipase family protein [Thermodesulfobacteriota bacterium]MDW8001842.1 patatin-like phospholipase family protein [Deltaproteobacteria bacterium]
MRRRIIYWIFTSFIALCVASCATAPETKRAKEPKIALVLSGGSAKGFAHVGVIRVLEQEKIPIHMIVGTSVGSLIGGLYAANPDSFQLEWTAFKIERSDILDFSLLDPKLGLVKGQKLESFVEREAKVKRIEETKIPFFAITTDLNTGETVILDRGPLARAIRASCAIPGIFAPVNFAGRTLVDGGLTNNIPCDIAKRKGADIVIAVNLLSSVKNHEIDSIVDIIGQSISIMMFEQAKEKLRYADVIIEPDVRNVSLFDFSKKKELMEEGIKAAKSQIPKIKELITRFRGEN